MHRSIATFIILSAAIILLLLSGCYTPGGPEPEGKHSPAPRAWTIADVDAAVTMSMEKIYSPAPTSNGTPPDECNYIRYLRIRPRTGSTDPNQADAIIVLIPGFLGGASSLEEVSRQMVYMALKQRGKRIEVWVVDRRPNNLEDLTGLNAAETVRDTNMALIYYYFGAKINGRKFAGFLEDKDVPFLSEFGLELDVRDVYTLITTKVPDPAVRRKKVFVGGHSMGGPFTAFFAGWDFDRNPATLDDAGYMNCAGLIGLDTVLAPTIPFLDVPAVEDILGVEAPSDTTPGEEEEYYAGLLDSIRKGYLPRMFPPLNVSPEMNALQELVAMEAAWHPDEESDLLFRTPYSDNIALNLHMLVCRNIDQFLFPIPSVRDFRYTNEALLGLLVDDNFQPINPLQASVGFINGGAVVERQFPLPQDWARLPELFILKNFINMEGQFSMNDAGSNYSQLGYGPVYTWANFDEIGNSTDPDYKSSDGSITYTTMGEEVSDIQDMARFLYKGPTNALEWYFATRANLDMVMALKDFGPKYGLTYFHGDKVPGMPQIDFITDKGPMVGQTDKLPPEIRILKGYNHLDVCIAAPDRPSRRPNELIDPILDFIMANNH